MIKNLIFDLGGVVLPLNPEQAWTRFESLGIKNTRQQMGVYGQTGIFRQLEDGSISEEEFQRALGQQAQEQSNYFDTSDPCFSYEQCVWAWCGYIDYVPLERLQNLLKLKEKYNVLLLSNTNGFLMSWANSTDFSGDGHPLSYYFHQVYLSYLLKDYKPSLTIYQKVLEQAGIKAEESVFLDDGPKNIEAAEQVGIHGLLVPKNEDWMPNLMALLNEENS